jgi:hypothetical protein
MSILLSFSTLQNEKGKMFNPARDDFLKNQGKIILQTIFHNSKNPNVVALTNEIIDQFNLDE